MEDYAEKMQRCNEYSYIEALEEERRKIQVFQRELPLCLELVTQAIEGCRQQLPFAGTKDYFNTKRRQQQQQQQQQSDCSDEQTSSGDGPVLEEFIPMKRCSSDDDDDDDDDDEQSHKANINTEKSGKKSDWLRSVQLWNQTPDPPHKEDSPKKESVMEVKKNGGAFRPFNKQKNKSPPAVPAAAASSSGGTNSGGSGGSRKVDKQGESQRKQRRCWSPELHRRFLNALQQLGGPHVATPKQIREFMKVDGLTNDEVKSHLQKYRLHTRRPNSGIHNNGNPQAPQFVVVGGIWVQPSEYGKMGATPASGEATGVTTTNGIYAPIAALPPSLPQASSSVTQRQQQHKQPKQTHSEERGSHCNSPATSSSTHTTTASPVY